MAVEDRDAAVRGAAFAFLDELTRRQGEVLPRALLERGFIFQGTRVPLVGPQGIFKPAALPDLPLSILTVPSIEGKAAPYEDEVRYDGLVYRYRGTDPAHHENVGLRRAMDRRVPLVCFHGIVPGLYLAVWPVYIVADDPARLAFTVQVDEPGVLGGGILLEPRDDIRRSYALRLVRQRMHQAGFRQRVLTAYRMTCAVCRLRHPELLDAAHILPDGHPQGKPVVPNGLSLCKLHRAAFDVNLMGVRPDYTLDVRSDVLREIDGPMLLHGLQGIHGQRISVPRLLPQRPHREFLEERYELFRRAS